MADLEHRPPSVAKTLARLNIGTEDTVQERPQKLLPVVERAVSGSSGVLEVLDLLEQDEGFAVHEARAGKSASPSSDTTKGQVVKSSPS
jgi:hypothetical protein